MKTLMTDIELAEALTVSRNTVRNWKDRGVITAAINEPGVLRFNLETVTKQLAKRAAKNKTQMVPTR